jgi:copper chaperone
MLDFKVEGMTCGHCEAAVTRAVQAVDPAARVTIDRKADRVLVDSSAEPEAVRHAIEAQGYTVRGSA